MGLFRTAGRAAVVGSVFGRVQRRQQQRFAAEDAAAAAAGTHFAPEPPTTPAPPPPVPAAVVDPTDHMLAQLKQLGELKGAGVLTDKEFQAQKARILGR
ncbi:Short C-terminal domain-containing protein [Arthrobacter sp. 9V]|uniref:SHOCT domain-containing protein n=1 Tax=Arthrobacter sp. 9V TaxID=2653132 RepID=UPI0012F3CB9A|nr:SHOCT domain-containing protein [Arthrobacter sp. 9V]VXA97416.1 Short C-terminal domain-containing protein [Arthrobacter sp. 9V]